MNHFSSLKILGLSLCLVFGLAACTPGDTTTDEAEDTQKTPEAVTPTPSPAPSALEQSAQGELRSVNIESMTFSVREVSGVERTFSFSPSTRITGVPNIQGLAGKQGSQVRVMYTAQGDINSATSIEISESAPATAPSGRKN
jgi:hypothetical protein